MMTNHPSSPRIFRKLVLALDTASPEMGLAVIGDNQILVDLKDDSGRAYSLMLLPILEATLMNNGISLNSVTRIVVNIGPGSFTGVRVGIATAKGLSQALKTSVIGVSSIDAQAFRIGIENTPIAVILKAPKNELYCGIRMLSINKLLSQHGDDFSGSSIQVGSFLAESFSDKPLILVGDSAPAFMNSFQPTFSTWSLYVARSETPSVAVSMSYVSEIATGNLMHQSIEAHYIRASDAEIKRIAER